MHVLTPICRISVEQSLRADAWALRALQTYQNGKVLLWAWISRGLTSPQYVAEWYCNGSLEEAKELMSRTAGQMSKLYQLDEIPDLAVPDQEALVDASSSVRLPGEKCQCWCIATDETELTPLPLWMRPSIDKMVLGFRREYVQWTDCIEKRKGKSLIPAQQKRYDIWLETHVRQLVLDHKRKCQVLQPGEKDIKKLKKNCVAFKVHLSVNPHDLRIEAGNGDVYNLKLMESKPIDDDKVPECLHFFNADDIITEAKSACEDDDQHALDAIQEQDPELAQDDGWIEIQDEDDDESGDEDTTAAAAKHVVGSDRPAYLGLVKLGLMERPNGLCVGVNLNLSTWRARTPTSPHFGRRWGKSAGRSERQALIRVMILMYEAYIENNEASTSAEKKFAKVQLTRLRQEWDKDPGKQ